MSGNRKLRVFLCHSSQDKVVARELYQRLSAEGWIDPWLDKEKLLPGQDWELEIEKSVESADVVIVCLSKRSVEKEGYYQKEIKRFSILLIKNQMERYLLFLYDWMNANRLVSYLNGNTKIFFQKQNVMKHLHVYSKVS